MHFESFLNRRREEGGDFRGGKGEDSNRDQNQVEKLEALIGLQVRAHHDPAPGWPYWECHHVRSACGLLLS